LEASINQLTLEASINQLTLEAAARTAAGALVGVAAASRVQVALTGQPGMVPIAYLAGGAEMGLAAAAAAAAAAGRGTGGVATGECDRWR
jgi:hypothetical protein